MKVFHCDHCDNLVFFENSRCLKCGATLAYLPDLGVVGSLDADGETLWSTPIERAAGKHYRLCANYTAWNTCNWAVPEEDPEAHCQSCRLTRVIPDQSVPGNLEAWYKLESAKKRLVYTLLALGLPLQPLKADGDGGLAFDFLADGEEKTLTGHANGVITLNIAEADDVERERRRTQLGEQVRTLLGHFRHEIGHYYWDRLIRDTPLLEAFRKVFGDESIDYGEALKRHYAEGSPPDWREHFVSSYASAHPWEDWAESFAHYLKIVDTLETAYDCGLRLRPKRKDEPTLVSGASDFDGMIQRWFPLTYALNNLNRGLGQPDPYPFVLAPAAVEKLRFVHDTIQAA